MTYRSGMLIQEAISKIILSGEHAVVYGTPAIALPVRECKAKTSIWLNNENSKEIIINAKQVNKTLIIKKNEKKNDYDPLELTVLNFLHNYGISMEQGVTLEIISDIPISGGMGSGAAIATSMIKALAALNKISMSNDEIFTQVFEIEKLYHGNPSGIDPRVIIFERPVYFIKNEKMETFDFEAGFIIAIINSGIKCPTKKAVDWVAAQRKNNPAKYESIFNNIASITQDIKKALEENNIINMGRLMNLNHIYLQEMGVSNKTIDELVNVCLDAGSKGSKLSGAGFGGIVISLIENEQKEKFINSLKSMGIKDIKLTSFGK